MLHEGFGHDSQMDFLEALVSSDAALHQCAHLHQHKAGHEGSHFMVPFCASFIAFFTFVHFLAFVFLVAAILATT
jgi:hypothetical protein